MPGAPDQPGDILQMGNEVETDKNDDKRSLKELEVSTKLKLKKMYA